jgi:hydrogenase maturation protease
LIFACGNPSRGDDALGPRLLEQLGLTIRALAGRVELLSDFQLQVEHALDLEGRERVLFVDADVACPHPFTLSRLAPGRDASYTSHALSPAAVLHAYTQATGRAPPPAYLLAIRGERFELGEPMSPAAERNLAAALTLVTALCRNPRGDFWEERAGRPQQAP